MLTADQGEKKITPPTVAHQRQVSAGEINGAPTVNGFQSHGIPPPINSDSLIINLHSQVHQGLEKVREAAQGLSKSLNKERNHNGSQVTGDHPEEIAVPLLDLMTQNGKAPKYAATLGFGEDGRTVHHRFDSRDTPHLLVVGGPDAGKTVMLRSIAASLAINNRQSEIQLAAICPITGNEEGQRNQASTWYALNYLPHMLCDIAFRHSDIIDLLTFLSKEISYREKLSFDHPRLIVLIDQADVLISQGGRRCAEPILRLAQKGEEVGIHLVLAAQSLESNTLSTQLLMEIPTRLIGRSPTTQSFQNPQLERENELEQLLGEGDFLHFQGDHVKRLQGGFIADQDLIPKLIEMNQHRAILLAKQVQSRLRLEQPPAHESRIKWPSKTAEQVPAGAR